MPTRPSIRDALERLLAEQSGEGHSGDAPDGPPGDASAGHGGDAPAGRRGDAPAGTDPGARTGPATDAPARPGRPASPPTDVVDTGAAFVVRMDLPGASLEQVDVGVADDVLTVEASPAGADDGWNGRVLRSERPATRRTRSIPLPEPVDETAVSARLARGVLTVTAPRVDRDPGEAVPFDGE